MSLGQRIKESRQGLGLTQRHLAEATQMTVQYISAIEQDKRVPSLPVLMKLSEQLGVTLDCLVIGGEGECVDMIAAIQADKSMNLEVKKSLITLINALRQTKRKS